jgi:hypothetical protein
MNSARGVAEELKVEKTETEIENKLTKNCLHCTFYMIDRHEINWSSFFSSYLEFLSHLQSRKACVEKMESQSIKYIADRSLS